MGAMKWGRTKMNVRVIRRTDVAIVFVLFIRVRLDLRLESKTVGATRVKVRVAKRTTFALCSCRNK